MRPYFSKRVIDIKFDSYQIARYAKMYKVNKDRTYKSCWLSFKCPLLQQIQHLNDKISFFQIYLSKFSQDWVPYLALDNRLIHARDLHFCPLNHIVVLRSLLLPENPASVQRMEVWYQVLPLYRYWFISWLVNVLWVFVSLWQQRHKWNLFARLHVIVLQIKLRLLW